MLDVIANSIEIRNAYEELSKRLTKGATRFRHRRVVWPPNRSQFFTVHWRKKERFWVVFDPAMLKNRYWIAFGIQEPQQRGKEPLGVRCEINPPKDGINRRCAGVFLKDSNGNVHLAHTGKVGGGKSGVGKEAFLKAYRGATQTVTWSDTGATSNVIVFGRLNEKSLLSNLAEFLVDVDNFKQDVNQRELLTKETLTAVKQGVFPQFSTYTDPATLRLTVVADGEEDSLVEEISSPPVRSITSLALLTSSDVEQCTEKRIPPFFKRPSYRFASYSGIPIPINAPVNPPTAPPTPNPARAPIMGPAAMRGPTPGIARAPIPASKPNTPPTVAPETAPVVAPSGALVDFSVPMSFAAPRFSGSSTEMSPAEKPDLINASVARSTPSRVE